MSERNDRLVRSVKRRMRGSLPKLPPLASTDSIAVHLSGETDAELVASSNLSKQYSQKFSLENLNSAISNDEVLSRLEFISKGNALDTVLEPVFMSLIDGTMRACNIGVRQGITPSRLYQECKVFGYGSDPKTDFMLDGYTEQLLERENITAYGKTASYNEGKMTRNGETVNLRNGKKMDKHKEAYFGDSWTGADEYGGDDIYKTKTFAKSKEQNGQAAETDHAISCSEIFEQLKGNKALNPEDIKTIANIDENYAVTSRTNNRGKTVGKFAKKVKEIEQEVKQGYVEDKNGKKTTLTPEQIETRKNQITKMNASQEAVNNKTNETVAKNIKSDRGVQKLLSTDAAKGSAHQSLGDLIMFAIKPLYYELRSCFSEGIEAGVGAKDFSEALKIRMARMKKYVLENAVTLIKDVAVGFIKNFISLLAEGIVNCFVGAFKNIMKLAKEGLRILIQSVSILASKTSSMAEKGDAILKLVAGSLSIFSAIGIETWLSSLGLPGPISILLASVLTAVITSILMLSLDKLDLFGTNKKLKGQRIDELLTKEIAATQAGIDVLKAQLS